MSSAVKDEIREILDTLPDDATTEELLDALYVRLRVREGLRAIEAGETVPDEDVRAELGLDR